MKKTLLTALTLALVIGGGTAVFAAGDDPRAPTTTTTAEDISGPCDEAEHANDPRCADGNARDDDAGDHRGRGGENEVREAEIGEDLPGPCDEAEHANDPRCTAVVPASDLGDNSGPGSQNSGPGSINSGHSGEAHDHGGDSGHGGGGEGDDD